MMMMRFMIKMITFRAMIIMTKAKMMMKIVMINITRAILMTTMAMIMTMMMNMTMMSKMINMMMIKHSYLEIMTDFAITDVNFFFISVILENPRVEFKVLCDCLNCLLFIFSCLSEILFPTV